MLVLENTRVTNNLNVKMFTKSKCQAPERLSADTSGVLADDLEFVQLRTSREVEEVHHRQKDRIGNDEGMQENVTCSAVGVRHM